MRSEVRREAISLLLGDLREFQNCTGQLHLCGLQTPNSVTSLSKAISKRVKKLNLGRGVAESAQKKVQEILEKNKNYVVLLSNLIPQDFFNLHSHPDGRVKHTRWDDWLQICWGHDHDTLSMLSIMPGTKLEKFVESVKKLPIIQAPASDHHKQQVEVFVDHHIHSSALYPPALQWTQWINTGINYQGIVSKKQYCQSNLNGYTLSDDKIREHRERSRLCQGYLSTARILLGAMLDFYELSKLPNSPISSDNDEAKCSDLTKKVSDLVYEKNGTKQELVSLLKEYVPELNNSSSKWLSKSIIPGSFQEEVYLFLQEERECIASLLWKAYHNELGIFIQEVLLAYLRCKGAWFQINSGNNLQELNPYEYVLLKNYDLSISKNDVKNFFKFKKFCDPMSHAIRRFYQDTNSIKKVEVRLPYTNRVDTNENINYLKSIFRKGNNVEELYLVLSFTTHIITKIDEAALQYINSLATDEKVIICGVDLVVTNESIDWNDYAKRILDMRSEIQKRQNKSCFITCHLDEENNVLPLKEMCEILTIVKTGKLRENDRISHGWSLLSEADNSSHTDPITLYKEEWNLIEARLDDLRRELKLDAEQENAVDTLKKKARFEGINADLDHNLMSYLAASLQPLVRQELIKRGILLEVCLTSSWRVAGIPLSIQDKHPIESWLKAEGHVLVGTDNPAVFPCTIESEYYSLELIKKQFKKDQPNMPEVTFQTSSNSQPRTHDVFLAHNSQDKPLVRAIASELTKRGLKPWLDEDEIPPGRSFQDEIQKAISLVKSAAIFIGSHGLGKWQELELRSFISHCVSNNIPVIPVLLPGVDNFDSLLMNQQFLKQFRWVSFSNGINDEEALYSLEWGITGKKPNTIQQNEKPGQVPTQEDIQTISPSTNEASGEDSCSCVDELGKLSKAELRKRMADRLYLEDVKSIWYDTFEEDMNRVISEQNQTVRDYVIALLDRVVKRRRMREFLQNICQECPDIANP